MEPPKDYVTSEERLAPRAERREPDEDDCVVFAALIVWALGGTFGTTGQPLDVEPAVAWGVVGAGSALVAFTLLLLVGKGPIWARATFGLGGLVAGLALTVNGGLAAAVAVTKAVTDGLEASPGADLPAWTFLIVYGSWFVAGLGVIAASWRYWAHRRDDCPACGPLLGS